MALNMPISEFIANLKHFKTPLHFSTYLSECKDFSDNGDEDAVKNVAVTPPLDD